MKNAAPESRARRRGRGRRRICREREQKDQRQPNPMIITPADWKPNRRRRLGARAPSPFEPRRIGLGRRDQPPLDQRDPLADRQLLEPLPATMTTEISPMPARIRWRSRGTQPHQRATDLLICGTAVIFQRSGCIRLGPRPFVSAAAETIARSRRSNPEWRMAISDERALIERCRRATMPRSPNSSTATRTSSTGWCSGLMSDRTQVDDLAQDVFSRSIAACRISAATRGCQRGSIGSCRTCAPGAQPAAAGSVARATDRGTGRRIDPGAADAAFADLELRDRLEKAIAQLPEQRTGS